MRRPCRLRSHKPSFREQARLRTCRPRSGPDRFGRRQLSPRLGRGWQNRAIQNRPRFASAELQVRRLPTPNRKNLSWGCRNGGEDPSGRETAAFSTPFFLLDLSERAIESRTCLCSLRGSFFREISPCSEVEARSSDCGDRNEFAKIRLSCIVKPLLLFKKLKICLFCRPSSKNGGLNRHHTLFSIRC